MWDKGSRCHLGSRYVGLLSLCSDKSCYFLESCREPTYLFHLLYQFLGRLFLFQRDFEQLHSQSLAMVDELSEFFDRISIWRYHVV
ncbi:hypothetical protein HanIR_Chr04g0163891 [Helianthus annuus]|nr:hypothetical protein HanIR_Chr04g0163891 [Helianthus annuus]